MHMHNAPVGVFDSGLGGISVLKEAVRCLPHEHFIYYGDNLHAPYGDRPEQEITRLSAQCADILTEKGVKALLVACNTATGAAIRLIRSKLDVPVVSMEPAIKPACQSPGNGKILMCATYATTQLERYKKLKTRMPDPERIIDVPCPGIVDIIEQGNFCYSAFEKALDKCLGRYEGALIDGLVLGCTHYIFIKDVFYRYARSRFRGQCRMFDGNAATVRQLTRVLSANDMLKVCGTGSVSFFTSGDRAKYQPLFNMLLHN